jgi:L-alanine-DL-glutamate epimerase-like enolase superfamily enzyme
MFRVRKIDAFGIAVPMKTPLKMSMGSMESCDNLVVRISDDSGRVGWGEAPSAPTFSGETTIGMIAAVEYMAPRVEGEEIVSPEAACKLVNPLMYGNQAAKSAIDMALMDLIGQHRGEALHAVLGGQRRERAAVIWLVAGTPDELQGARRKRDEGFVAFKVKVAVNGPEADLDRARATRSVVGSEVRVSADANQGYSPEDALVFAKGAGDAGIDFFEQPVFGGDVDSMRACAEVCAVPIGADEGLHSLADIRHHHDVGAAEGGSLKLIKFGGTGQLMEAGRLMHALGMKINLAGKAANTSIGAAAAAHVALAVPNLDWDISLSSQYLADDVVQHPIAIEDGHIVTPSDGPGLGITVDEDKIGLYRRT